MLWALYAGPTSEGYEIDRPALESVTGHLPATVAGKFLCVFHFRSWSAHKSLGAVIDYMYYLYTLVSPVVAHMNAAMCHRPAVMCSAAVVISSRQTFPYRWSRPLWFGSPSRSTRCELIPDHIELDKICTRNLFFFSAH